jgi:hypothetical protein
MDINSQINSDDMTRAIRRAYKNLSPHDQEVIARVAKGLIKNMKAKYPDVIFGPDSALELLACIGMGINDNRIRLYKP